MMTFPRDAWPPWPQQGSQRSGDLAEGPRNGQQWTVPTPPGLPRRIRLRATLILIIFVLAASLAAIAFLTSCSSSTIGQLAIAHRSATDCRDSAPAKPEPRDVTRRLAEPVLPKLKRYEGAS